MRLVSALIVTLLCGLVFRSAVAADNPPGPRRGGGLRLEAPYLPPGREARQNEQRNRMSAGDAAKRAQSMNGGGRVLAVEPSGEGYRVKLLRDGEVRVVFVQ